MTTITTAANATTTNPVAQRWHEYKPCVCLSIDCLYTQRLHKCLATNEAIISPTYLTCLPLSLIFEEILFYPILPFVLLTSLQES